MKLRDWMAFNKPFMDCDFIVRIFKRNSYSFDDMLLETVVSWDVCDKIFGNYELARLSIDNYPGKDYDGFKIILWESEDV